MQNYSTVASRNLIDAELAMLKHAEFYQVLGSFGAQKTQPLNKTDTRVFRRTKPFNSAANETPQITAANFRTSEGVTPTANTIDFTDVTVVVEQYAVLFKFSSKMQYMYEDNIPEEMRKQVGETIGEIAEKVAFGEAKAGTSVIYANGTTRAGLNTPISIEKLRQAARTMENNRAHHVTTKIKSGPDFGETAVEPAYIVMMSTDVSSDVRDLPHFTPITEYGGVFKPVHEREIGACEEFRFVPSSLLSPFLAAGSGTLNGMVSAGGANTDVYPVIIIAEDCLGHISLKGHGPSGISPTLIPANVKNHANPSGMFGYVGGDFWYNCVRLNENWMTRIECCATKLIA